MTVNKFIEEVIKKGNECGITSLNDIERMVFLISEAEIICDMEGIDSFLKNYDDERIEECAIAFETIGAKEISDIFKEISTNKNINDVLLNRLNELIINRIGYNYESIYNIMEVKLTENNNI